MMCLGIPMIVVEVRGNEAVVESGGVEKNIRIDLIGDVKKGDYLLIHAGFAIERVDPEEARETIELIREVYRAGLDTRKA